MPLQSLAPEKLRTLCSPERFSFQSTAELSPVTAIIGQPRGTRAIEFGVGIRSHGYNIFVLGAEGTGRSTAIRQFLEERTRQQPPPSDWIYVHNFAVSYQPNAIALPAGLGARLQNDMHHLVNNLAQDLPQAFQTDAYEEAVETVRRQVEQQQNELLQAVRLQAAEAGFALLQTASGFGLASVRDGRPLDAREVQMLPVEQQQALQEAQQALADELEQALRRMQRLELDARQRVKEIDQEAAATAVQHLFQRLRDAYAEHSEVIEFLDAAYRNLLGQVAEASPGLDDQDTIDLTRYEVNLFVDNSQTPSAPVVIELNPEYHTLFGRIEYEMQSGVLSTHFTNLKCGALHRANGGYLILQALDLVRQPEAWSALKRTLKSSEIRLQALSRVDSAPVLAKSLDPEPIPLDVKVVLLGSPDLYYALYDQDDDFRELFKARADFDDTMPRTPENEQAYAQFIATRCREENLTHFDPSAVAKAVEYGSRLAEDCHKLSTYFGQVADLVREADYWAGRNGRTAVNAEDVQKALFERRYRANYLETRLQEEILEGSLLIATEGSVAGQVNGLSVYDIGDYTFGQPGRITARTFMGEGGVIHIERETEMSGPIHDKGVLTLYGYLGGTYAQHQPLSLTASLTFEQTYGGIEGDSASAAELYAIFSCLSRIPVRQGIAVTGSVNQHGEVQPIGSVNEKIEGFFRICKARGLTGEQGVIIPASNVNQLMLDEEVVEAVRQGEFHVWAVKTVDEGIELLTGMPAGKRKSDGSYAEGTVHHAVQQRLRELAEELKAFGDRDGDEDEEEDEA